MRNEIEFNYIVPHLLKKIMREHSTDVEKARWFHHRAFSTSNGTT